MGAQEGIAWIIPGNWNFQVSKEQWKQGNLHDILISSPKVIDMVLLRTEMTPAQSRLHLQGVN